MDNNETIKLNDEEIQNAAGGAGSERVYRCTVVRGDTLIGIANRFHTTMQTMIALNPFIVDVNNLQEGWVLRLPDPYCPIA